MVVNMESVCSSVANVSSPQQQEASNNNASQQQQQHPQHSQQQQQQQQRSWYDSTSASFSQGLTSGTAAASDELADAYFKGQNYFSQMQGAYQGAKTQPISSPA